MKAIVTFEIWKAKDGFRWRARHRNGRIVAESGEGYKRKIGCRTSMRNFIHDVAHSEYTIVEN